MVAAILSQSGWSTVLMLIGLIAVMAYLFLIIRSDRR